MARFRPKSSGRSICDFYGAIVAQARAPAFYASYEVPDTVQGRFDLLVLHPSCCSTGSAKSKAAATFGQKLFDLFCQDLDAASPSAPRDRQRPSHANWRFAEAFYGRRAVYLGALSSGEEKELEKTLTRNIFQGNSTGGARRLARYARAVSPRLAEQGGSALLRCEIAFPSPESIADE